MKQTWHMWSTLKSCSMTAYTQLRRNVLCICGKHSSTDAQANFVWAYAMLDERMGAACLKALAAQAQKQLPQFEAQNLANMMWAFAKLAYTPDTTLLQSCEAHAIRTARVQTARLGALLFAFRVGIDVSANSGVVHEAA